MPRKNLFALSVAVVAPIATMNLAIGGGSAVNGELSMSFDSPDNPPPPSKNPAAGASNAFGLDLYRRLSGEEPATNLFVSPYSVSVALTMAAEGARGETEAEMARVLHFPKAASGGERDVTVVHRGNQELREYFRAAAGKTDPKLRKRIAELREQLDDANQVTEHLQNEGKWREADRARENAQSLARKLNQLRTEVDRFDLRIANALWVEKSFDLELPYVRTIDRYYESGGVTPMDFVRDPEKSRIHINQWVEDHTEKRIKNLIPKGMVASDTRLVITNAVYFLGQWAEPFEKNQTRDEDFTRIDDSKVSTPLMHDSRRDGVPYAAFNGDGSYFDTPREVPADESARPPTYPDDGFTMIELPYKGDELSMVFLAPRTPAGLADLEQMLTEENLSSWLSQMDSRRVNVAVPKFRLESKFELGDVLQAMGMKRAFISPARPDGADFGGMSKSSNPREQLFIGAVLHKSFVAVDEEGTEAAAATALVMRAGAAAPRVTKVPFIPEFRADRPFVFLIRDRESGLILFIGRMMDPTA